MQPIEKFMLPKESGKGRAFLSIQGRSYNSQLRQGVIYSITNSTSLKELQSHLLITKEEVDKIVTSIKNAIEKIKS